MNIFIWIIFLVSLLFSIIIHEIAHGSVALSLGDPTAKYQGRLTLNPLKHLDFFGSIILPITLGLMGGPIIGWAKPVPVNPYNFRDQKWGNLKVSLAGPLANFFIAVFFGLITRFIPLSDILFTLFINITRLNFLLGLFNLVPIPPLDGSHILFSILPRSFSGVQVFLERYGLFVLVFFIFWGSGFLFLLAQTLSNILIYG